MREIVIKKVESVADSVWVYSMGDLFALKREGRAAQPHAHGPHG